MDSSAKPAITLFHCINAYNDVVSLPWPAEGNPEMQVVKLPCAAIVQDVYLLRAFEAGADAVVVLICSEGQCLFLSGNTRTEKRIERVKKMLDEIGLGRERLSLLSVSSDDEAASAQTIQKALSDLENVGPSPATQALSVSA